MLLSLYRHDEDAVIVTAIRVSWTESTATPGSNARMNATIHSSDAPPWGLPTSRDWVMLYHGGRARFFGRIRTVEWGAGADASGVSADPVTISATGWLDLDHDIVTSAARIERIGTLYPVAEWWQVVDALIATGLQSIGESALKTFLRLAYPVRVPAAAFGLPKTQTVLLGDVIAVAYDDTTADALGLKGPCEPIQGFSLQGVRSNLRTNGRAGQVLTSTFASVATLIELTPVLVRAKSGAKGPLIAGDTLLTLRYRMSPFRATALKDSLRAQLGAGLSAPPARVQKIAQLDLPAYNRTTWPELPMHTLAASEIARIDGGLDASRDITSATAWLSALSASDDIKTADVLGLPIIDAERAERDGLRHQTTLWPFMPIDTPTAENIGEIDALIIAIAATAYQFGAPGAYFQSGSVRTTLLRTDIAPGERVALHVGGRTLTAYVTSVSHDASADDRGPVRGSSLIQFERGLWDESLRSPLIYVHDSGEAETSGTATPSGVTPCSDPFANCVSGLPYTGEGADPFAGSWNVFPDWTSEAMKITLDRTKLLWLQKWFECRCTKSVKSTTTTLWNRAFDRRISGAYGAGLPSDNIAYVAATAYVIEKYWKTVYPDAQIQIVSVHRTANDEGTHASGAAMDFALAYNGPGTATEKFVPVFQTYLSLRLLTLFRRIPLGGVGLYLNVNPTTGISGLGPDQAGKPSKGRRIPGASAEIHYDIRGSFGARSSFGRGADSWLWTDWTGDGYDEVGLSMSYLPSLADPSTGLVREPGTQLTLQRTPNALAQFVGLAVEEAKQKGGGTVGDALIGVLANIADTVGFNPDHPNGRHLDRMLGSLDDPGSPASRFGATRVSGRGNVSDRTRELNNTVQRFRAVPEKRIAEMMAERRTSPGWEQREIERAPLRDTVRRFWSRTAVRPSSDSEAANMLLYALTKSLDPLAADFESVTGGRVPNIMQVVGVDAWCDPDPIGPPEETP